MHFRIALLLLSTGATPALTAQDLPQLVSQLNHKDYGKSRAAYRALAKNPSPKLIPFLYLQLGTYGERGQDYGTRLLAALPEKARRSTLRKYAKTDNPFLAVCINSILVRDGDKKAIPSLVKGLRAPKQHFRTRIKMIGRVTDLDQTEVRAAVRAMAAPGLELDLLITLCDHFWRTDDPLAIPAVEKILRDGLNTHGNVRALCAAFLVAKGGRVHAKALGKAIANQPYIHGIVWSYLDKAKKIDLISMHGIADHVKETKHPHSITHALKLLRKHHYRGYLVLLRETTQRQNVTIAKAAFKVLASMPEELQPKELKQLLSSEKPWLALFAAKTLRRRDDLSGLDRTLELVKASGRIYDQHRVEAVKVLGGFREDRAVQPLIDLLAHRSGAVRGAAFTQIGYLLRDLFPYRRFDFRKTGFAANAPAEKRKLGIAQIQTWWDENRN